MSKQINRMEKCREVLTDIGWGIMGFFSALMIPFVWFPKDVWDWVRQRIKSRQSDN